MNTLTVHFEHTDTFGGDANYSWVRRDVAQLPDTATRRSLVQRAKKFAGLTGMRCEVLDVGDVIIIRPRGLCQIVFATIDPDNFVPPPKGETA